MKEDISKITIIGYSHEGDWVIEKLFEKINLGPKSSIILIPRSGIDPTYNYLCEKKERVYPIFNNQTIKPQSVYVNMDDLTLYSSSPSALRRKLEIKEKNGEYIFSLGDSQPNYVDQAFCAVADAFKDKTIGLILYEFGSFSFDAGLARVREVGGTALVQKISELDHHVPSNKHSKVVNDKTDLPVDKLASKLEELLQ